jgi:hypothetical protein
LSFATVGAVPVLERTLKRPFKRRIDPSFFGERQAHKFILCHFTTCAIVERWRDFVILEPD